MATVLTKFRSIVRVCLYARVWDLPEADDTFSIMHPFVCASIDTYSTTVTTIAATA